MKRHAPATARNREPILGVLRRVLGGCDEVLEIASGSGEHAVYFASALPVHTWQPTDIDPIAVASIAEWRADAELPNLAAPIALDVCSLPWPIERADAVVCINMIHIAPWRASVALFDGAARILAPGAPLVSYGPYRFGGRTAPSNDTFDASLRAQNSEWGVRDVDELSRVAAAAGFALEETLAMPANNHTLVWRRLPTSLETSPETGSA
jgi:SAM-dependent methyltransferase